MHPESLKNVQEMRTKYCPQSRLRVLDVGASSNPKPPCGNYHAVFKDCFYSTLDRDGADFNVAGYDWPHERLGLFDVVVSGQAFEHDPYFWRTLENIGKVLHLNATVIINLPSTGPIHRFPVDCYRFFPDSMVAFAEVMQVEVLEVVHLRGTVWEDVCGVFRRGGTA